MVLAHRDPRAATILRPAARLLVQRKRLCAAIESPYLASITTIVAGAGFGKTTLARQWAEHSLRQVYRIDLKQDGRDRARFLARLSEIGRASTTDDLNWPTSRNIPAHDAARLDLGSSISDPARRLVLADWFVCPL